MGFVLDILKAAAGFLLGKTADVGKGNIAAGVINYAWALPAIGWVWLHRTETIIFQIVLSNKETIQLFTTSYLGLSLVIGAVFLYVEFNRRST